MKPFLKWAGNKYSIIARIKEILPSAQRLIEPFAGSAAAFLNTEYPRYLLADTNQDLIGLFKHLQLEGEAFIAYCERFFVPENNQAEKFYELRELFNTTTDERLKAALFVYLNKHCFNGLCRYNASGQFNVPFGRYKKPYFPLKELYFFYVKAERADFLAANFVTTMQAAEAGDVVYCDPPYVPLSATANFTSYSAGGFNAEQQLELARQAERLASKGIPVVISNHDTEFVIKAYSNARIIKFDVQRYISCHGANRSKAGEVLAIFE